MGCRIDITEGIVLSVLVRLPRSKRLCLALKSGIVGGGEVGRMLEGVSICSYRAKWTIPQVYVMHLIGR